MRKLLYTRWQTLAIPVRGVARIRYVGCAHPGFASYLARIRCPKVRCVHPSKWPKKTLACMSLRKEYLKQMSISHWKPRESLKPNIWIRTYELWFLLPGFYNSHRVPLSNHCLWGGIQSTGTISHATWTLTVTVSAARAIFCCKNPVVKCDLVLARARGWADGWFVGPIDTPARPHMVAPPHAHAQAQTNLTARQVSGSFIS